MSPPSTVEVNLTGYLGAIDLPERRFDKKVVLPKVTNSKDLQRRVGEWAKKHDSQVLTVSYTLIK